jgi:hypothetical protein
MITNAIFVTGLDCLRKLYLSVKTPVTQTYSHEISDFKRLFQECQYPGGISAAKKSKEEQINFSHQQLSKCNTTTYDCLFRCSEFELGKCDVVKVKNGKVECVFVTPGTEITEVFFYDCAYSIYVLRKLSIDIDSVKIAHVNKLFVRQGQQKVTPSEFWQINDVTNAMLKFQIRIEQKVKTQLSVLKQKTEPNAEIAQYCFKPTVCVFKEKCWGSLSKNNIFKMKSMHIGKKLGYYYRGIESMEQLVERNINFKDNQKVQLRCSINNEIAIDYEGLQEWLKPIHENNYVLFLDFETIAPIVPAYAGSTSYTKIPFQFSLHELNLTTNKLTHYEYLADPTKGLDTRESFLNYLLQACAKVNNACPIIVYNNSFEGSIIKNLIVDFPQSKNRLLPIQKRFYDLMDVFNGVNGKPLYYDPRFENSYSLKTVLPILTDETYSHLEIKDGLTASLQYYNMLHMTAPEKEQTRSNLLKYCHQDTFATVKILQFLMKITKMNSNNSNNIKTYENERISKRISKRTT